MWKYHFVFALFYRQPLFGFSRVHFGFGGGGDCLIEVGWVMERCVVDFLECESSFVCPLILFVFQRQCVWVCI